MTMQTLDKPLQDDPLLRAIAALSAHHGRPVPADLIGRGLPLDSAGRLPLRYVGEACDRAGLLARPTALSDEALQPMALPVLALRKDGRPALILGRKRRQVLVGDGEGGGTWTAIADVLDAVEPEGWFVQGKLYLDGRSRLHDEAPSREWFWAPLRTNYGIYGYAALASLVINMGAMLATFYVMAVYDRVIPNRSVDTLWVLTAGVLALYAFDFVLKTLRSRLIDTASRRFDVMVGTRVFGHVLGLSPAERPQSSGTIANTVREFDSLRDFFTSTTITVLGDLPFLVMFIGVIAFFAGPVAWVPLVAIPVTLGAAALFLRPMGRLTDELYKLSAQRNAHLYESVAGLDVLRTTGATGWARRKWDRMLVEHAEGSLVSRQLAQVSLNVTVLLQSTVSVGVIVTAALLVSDGKLSTGAMVACTLLSGRALAPLATLAGLISRVHSMRASLASLDKLMQAKGDEGDATDRMSVPHVAGSLAFHDAALAFPGPGGAPGRAALSGVSLSVAAGEHVAIVGRVGSGKSSLLGLAVRLHAPTNGHVLLDGMDVRQIAPDDLRRHIGYVPQDPHLFHGTVRENITLGHPGATDAEVLKAAEVACLKDLLAGSAEGLAAQVGENGRAMSGGMRQAVTIARAIVADPPVLLLDEPTSMMDHATETALLERLFAMRRGKTTVVVTHRPAVLAFLERVVVVEAGRVLADGPKAQVLQHLGPPRTL
ncbi:Toxin RTX-I translocation ATP-binding protein [compost metagenome]